MTPLEDAPVECLDEEDICRIIGGLRLCDRKLSISADRWQRSKWREVCLEDRHIDLRITLEGLYLKDFDDERIQEMRFRLALFGPWHLAEGPEVRQSIRKTLRDAYDMASKAVHGGEVLDEPRADLYHKAQAELAQLQDLSRNGILKVLREGRRRTVAFWCWAGEPEVQPSPLPHRRRVLSIARPARPTPAQSLDRRGHRQWIERFSFDSRIQLVPGYGSEQGSEQGSNGSRPGSDPPSFRCTTSDVRKGRRKLDAPCTRSWKYSHSARDSLS